MYFFTIFAKPKLQTSEDVGGACVACWINFAMQEGAELLAKHYIEQEGWVIEQVDSVHWVEREDYEDHPEDLRYYQEAEVDGASFVFHQWPTDSEDASNQIGESME